MEACRVGRVAERVPRGREGQCRVEAGRGVGVTAELAERRLGALKVLGWQTHKLNQKFALPRPLGTLVGAVLVDVVVGAVVDAAPGRHWL